MAATKVRIKKIEEAINPKEKREFAGLAYNGKYMINGKFYKSYEEFLKENSVVEGDEIFIVRLDI